MDWKKGRFHPCPNFLNHFPEKLVDHFLVTTCVPNKVCDLSWPFHHQDWKIPRSNEHYQFRWSKHKWNYVNHQTSTSPETVASRGHRSTQLEIMILVAWSWIKVLNLPHHQTHHRLVWLRLCGLTCTAVWTSVWGVRGMVAREHWEGQGVLRPCAHLCDGWCKCHYWTVWSSLHLWKGWWDVQTHGVIPWLPLQPKPLCTNRWWGQILPLNSCTVQQAAAVTASYCLEEKNTHVL